MSEIGMLRNRDRLAVSFFQGSLDANSFFDFFFSILLASARLGDSEQRTNLSRHHVIDFDSSLKPRRVAVLHKRSEPPLANRI